MRQIVGLKCTLCQRTIDSIVEGYFCPACGCPVHEDCPPKVVGQQPNACSTCGSAADVVAEYQRVAREQAAIRDRDVQTQHSCSAVANIVMGTVLLLVGIGASLMFCVISANLGVGVTVVATGIIGCGLAQLITGIIMLR